MYVYFLFFFFFFFIYLNPFFSFYFNFFLYFISACRSTSNGGCIYTDKITSARIDGGLFNSGGGSVAAASSGGAMRFGGKGICFRLCVFVFVCVNVCV
jgi:hypothetical protein